MSDQMSDNIIIQCDTVSIQVLLTYSIAIQENNINIILDIIYEITIYLDFWPSYHACYGHACDWTSVVGIIVMLERFELESFKLKSFLFRKDRVKLEKS